MSFPSYKREFAKWYATSNFIGYLGRKSGHIMIMPLKKIEPFSSDTMNDFIKKILAFAQLVI